MNWLKNDSAIGVEISLIRPDGAREIKFGFRVDQINIGTENDFNKYLILDFFYT